MSYTIQTAATDQSVTIEEVRAQLRIDPDMAEEDPLLSHLIKAAEEYVLDLTNRVGLVRTFNLNLHGFPNGPIRVYRTPLIAVSQITYTDTDGASQTWAASGYQVDTSAVPGMILPAHNQVYPVARSVLNTVQVRFTAGYATAITIPKSYIQLILALVGHWYENREPVLIGGANQPLPFYLHAMINQYRYREL